MFNLEKFFLGSHRLFILAETLNFTLHGGYVLTVCTMYRCAVLTHLAR